MKLKVIMSILITASLFISTLNINALKASAIDDSTAEPTSEEIKYTTLEETENYSKVKVEDFTNGTVEYIESTLVNGQWEYVITTDDKDKLEITSVGTDIYLDGEPLTVTSSVFKDTSRINESVVAQDPLFSYQISDPTMATASTTKWVYHSTTKGTSAWKYMNATIIAAAIATALQVHAGLVLVTSIATSMKINEMSHTYWLKSNYRDANRNSFTCRTAANTSFYKYSNYTGLVRVSGLLVNRLDPCASGY